MNPEMIPVIQYDDIDAWVRDHLQPHFPDKHISVIPRDYDATGESKFVTKFDADIDITIEELCQREIKEHSHGSYVHFYVNDIKNTQINVSC